MTDGGAPIYVHSKVLVVDDRLLRIGSSNINNRSMGFDSECDVAIEAVGSYGAFNLGQLIGLRGLGTLIPLLAMWGGVGGLWLRLRRKS